MAHHNPELQISEMQRTSDFFIAKVRFAIGETIGTTDVDHGILVTVRVPAPADIGFSELEERCFQRALGVMAEAIASTKGRTASAIITDDDAMRAERLRAVSTFAIPGESA